MVDKKGGATKGKGKKVEVNIINKVVTRLHQRSFFIKSCDSAGLLDSNYVGRVVLSESDNNRQVYQKWEFNATDTPGVYTLKSILSGLLLSGDELGNVFTDVVDQYNSFQKWYCLETTSGNFVIKNYSSNLALTNSILNDLYSREVPGSKMAKVQVGKETKMEEVPGEILSNMQWNLSLSR